MTERERRERERQGYSISSSAQTNFSSLQKKLYTEKREELKGEEVNGKKEDGYKSDQIDDLYARLVSNKNPE